LARFFPSNLSVAQFCDAEGVSTASFYQWQRKFRKLSSHDLETGGGKDAAASSAKPATNRRGGFQTVHVTSSLPRAVTAPEPVLTVCLPGGIAVQVADHPATIEAVMRQLIGGDQEPTAEGGAPAC
jgi:hypothetical protein